MKRPDYLLTHIRERLQTYDLLRPDALLVVAVSGGPDSLCLLHVLWQLREQSGPALHCAHLDHAFRGDESAAEAQFVAETANAWHIAATVERHNVPATIAAAGGINKQAAARAVRYAFLARVALAQQANAVVVAHHANDQAETVLLHLLHGSGLAGLRGMRPLVPWDEWALSHPVSSPSSPPLIRPLLDISRAEIERYCAEHALAPRNDPSNESLHYTRNRIRADLLPHMAHYNPHIVAALGRMAQVCADDYASMQQQLDTLWNDNLVDIQPTYVRFFHVRWHELPIALQRYAIRRAVWLLTGTDDLSFEQCEIARTAATHPTGFQHTLEKGLVVLVLYDSFLLGRGDVSSLAAHIYREFPQLASDQDEVPLTIPGTTLLSEGWQVICQFDTPPEPITPISGQEENSRTGAQAHRPDKEPDILYTSSLGRGMTDNRPWHWQVALDADMLGDEPLVLRRRRPGDRFRPAGGRGSRRIQDFFVDQKVPHVLRDAWPIVATPSAIVWVAGLRVDARYQVTAETRRVLWVAVKVVYSYEEMV